MPANTKKNDLITKYLQEEGLLALEPVYREKQGSSRVYTRQGVHPDSRSISWLVQRLAAHYSVDLPALRRQCGKLLGMRSHISLPLDAGLVLLPVKMRRALSPGETTTGYINLPQVDAICRPREGKGKEQEEPFLSRVVFKGGQELPTLNTPETLRERLRQGEQALQDFLKRRYPLPSQEGLKRERVMEILPPCDCVLKDLLARLISL